MASGQLVLCDVLCFVKEKFANTPVKVLKSMLTDFYTAETLSEAKICLLVVLLACLSKRIRHTYHIVVVVMVV